MRFLYSLLLLFFTYAHANEFSTQFDQLKSQDWSLLCQLGEKALIEEKLTDLDMAQIHARLASSYFYLGEYDSMKTHIIACEKFALDLSSKQYLLRSLYLLSAYYRGKELFVEAQAAIEKALELINDGVDDCLKAKIYFNAGAAYADDPTCDPLQAISFYQKALTLFEQASSDAYRTQIRLAKSWLLLSNYEEAWTALTPLYQVDLEPRVSVHLLYVTAQLEMAQGNFDLALVRIEEALPLAKQLKMSRDIERLQQLRDLL